MTSDDVVYDLGSGDGRIVIAAARQYGARGVGIEIDAFSADISEATVVTLYLLQSFNERLRPKLVRELETGARVVSHVFNMGPEWPPAVSRQVDGHPIHLWTVGDR